MVVDVHRQLRWRGWVLPESPVRNLLRSESLRRHGPVVPVDLSRVLGRPDDDFGRVNAVRVFFPLPQFTTNKTDGNHSTIAPDHLVLRVSELAKLEDSYFGGFGLKLSRV